MKCTVNGVPMHYVEHGHGTPVLTLHGAGVDHREMLATIEPALARLSGYRRVYVDLPGMGDTPAPDAVQSADDVLDLLLGLVDRVVGDSDFVAIGHSAGAYYAQAVAEVRRDRAAGLALVCPLVDGLRDVPEHTVVHTSGDLRSDQEFRDYFVVHTRDMLDRYAEHVEPATHLVDQAALERIGDRWQLSARPGYGELFDKPVLIVTGRQDSVVGYAGQWDLLGRYPRATFAMLDRAGHALPHEQSGLLGALLEEWLERVTEHAAD
jgi:pimeloyl-ACP methyl ester carboxylesterase